MADINSRFVLSAFEIHPLSGHAPTSPFTWNARAIESAGDVTKTFQRSDSCHLGQRSSAKIGAGAGLLTEKKRLAVDVGGLFKLVRYTGTLLIHPRTGQENLTGQWNTVLRPTLSPKADRNQI